MITIGAVFALALVVAIGAWMLRAQHARPAADIAQERPPSGTAKMPAWSPPSTPAKAAASPGPAPSTAPSPLAARSPSRVVGAPPLDEASLMAQLRGLGETDPPLTLRLAREGNARFPDSPDAPQRAWMIVKSLVNMEKFQEARAEAQTMVDRYPGTSWALDIQRHLLSHPLD